MKKKTSPKLKPHIYSFFAGIGLLDLGFEYAGLSMQLVNEYSPSFLYGYKYSRNKLNIPSPEQGYHEGDVTEFLSEKNSKTLSGLVKKSKQNADTVGFIAGPPCPDFSVGGKNKGANGENGRLSATYIELVCKHKPDFFLFENVKGLWKTKKHRDFYESIKKKTQASGYMTTEKVINCIEYGVPQDRQRIVLLGFAKELLSDMNIEDNKSSAFPEGLFPWRKYASYSEGEVFSLPWPSKEPFHNGSKRKAPPGIPLKLTVEYWFRKNNVLKHPNAKHHFNPKAGITRFRSVDEGDDSKKSYKRLHRWRYSPTAAYGNNEVHLHPYLPRRISAAEAFAVQSMPKGFELPPDMTLTDMFKSIGNGVPYLASKAIAKSIILFLNGRK